MTLNQIYVEFQALSGSGAKIKFLEELKSQNLKFEINYDALMSEWALSKKKK